MYKKSKIRLIPFICVICLFLSCNDDFLEEKPLGFLNSDVLLVDKAGLESAMTGLHQAMREELNGNSLRGFFAMILGTDIATTGPSGLSDYRNYSSTQTSVYEATNFYWEWAYLKVFPRANTIIEYANKPDVEWVDESEKNAIIAEARFLRAYAYNALANLYGGVPIVEEVQKAPKFDYLRVSRKEVLEFVKNDLLFASQWLPDLAKVDGRIVKAAADHLLAEVYISLEDFPNAIQSATDVIDSKLYRLMTERFGTTASQPGDVYYDLFKEGNQNRSGGNMETIWCWQIEHETPGGHGPAGGNIWLFRWAPRWWSIKDPDGKAGMVLTDSLGRGASQCRPSPYLFNGLWGSDLNKDIRCSKYNLKRNWYYNNPASAYFNKEVDFNTAQYDSMLMYPQFMKATGKLLDGTHSKVTYTDIPIIRLAETYLLRAEVYMLAGDLNLAAVDINVVRSRAKATPVRSDEVNIDYILDERTRELLMEEPRRRTLVRTGKLVERVKRYNMRKDTQETIKEHHRWWPIPQKAIDANIGVLLEQNSGY